MIKNKILTIIAVIVLATAMSLVITGCGSSEETAETLVQDDVSIEGDWADSHSQRAMMTIVSTGDDEYDVTVSWGGSATETAIWTFSGAFDRNTGLLEYTDGRKVISKTDENGKSEVEVVYEGSNGSLTYSDAAFTWKDSKDDSVSDCYFEAIASHESLIPPAEEWTENDVDTAEAAAEGAGLDSFVVNDEYTIGDIEFKAPTFNYLDKVAQASYEEGAAGLYIRKASGIYGAPLTDRDLDNEFPKTWTQDIGGVEVECFGFAADKAVVAQWNKGEEAFAVTSQGLGGEEIFMTPDEVEAVVSSVK